MKNLEDEYLWAYLDGALRPREYAILSKRLWEEPELKHRLDELQAVHTLLGNSLPSGDMTDSTDRVVDAVVRQLEERPDTDTPS